MKVEVLHLHVPLPHLTALFSHLECFCFYIITHRSRSRPPASALDAASLLSRLRPSISFLFPLIS